MPQAFYPFLDYYLTYTTGLLWRLKKIASMSCPQHCMALGEQGKKRSGAAIITVSNKTVCPTKEKQNIGIKVIFIISLRYGY